VTKPKGPSHVITLPLRAAFVASVYMKTPFISPHMVEQDDARVSGLGMGMECPSPYCG